MCIPVSQPCDAPPGMSGPRPTHLGRRGAIYFVRFRLPADLARASRVTDVRRSLRTADIDEARRRCLDASRWFRNLVDRLRAMGRVTREDLEAAAVAYFGRLAAEADQPRRFDDENFESDVDFNIEATRERIKQLDDQLRANKFEAEVGIGAADLARALATSLDALDQKLQLLAKQLAAKAQRAQMRYLEQALSSPALPYQADDPLFASNGSGVVGALRPATADHDAGYPTLAEQVDDYLAKMERSGLGQSHIDEVGRALNWLVEEIGGDTPMNAIAVATMRRFRNDVQRMDRTQQGRATSFKNRLTDRRDRQIAHATASKYWSAIGGLFQWCRAEGRAPHDPTELLKLERRKGEERRSPPPFNDEEVLKFLQSPLYQGHRSHTRLFEPGDCRQRGQKWWAGILFMFTGARAGEITQLLPADFEFHASVPFVRVREEDEHGEKRKSVKTQASKRDIPLLPILLELGLKEFVERRRAIQPNARVFEQFRMGTRGKLSEGMVRFWGDYLRTYGLHKPGRSTHVWRHTVIANLRAHGAAEEDIQAVVGHDRKTTTSGYGGEYPLSRKLETMKLIDYGFGVLEAVGGPYSASRHMV